MTEAIENTSLFGVRGTPSKMTLAEKKAMAKKRLFDELVDKFYDAFKVKIYYCPECWFSPPLYIKYTETEEYKKELLQYRDEVEHAEKTMTVEEFDKWDLEHDQPDMPQQTMYIPLNDSDILENLMKESIEKGIDLLWPRYKDNLVNYSSDVII